MRRPKVLIFMAFDYPSANGTTLWTTNLFEIMARIPNVDFVVVFGGILANRNFIQKVLGVNHIFLPLEETSNLDGSSGAVSRTLHILSEKYYFWNERLWRKQKHIDAELVNIIRERQPDLVILGGLSAAFCAPSISSLPVPCGLIILSNMVPIYRDYKAKGGRPWMGRKELWFYRHFNWVPDLRIARYVNRIYRRCAAIITLTQNDLPTGLPDHVIRTAIPPILSRSDKLWCYQQTRSVLFVGNVFAGTTMHFPNAIAIEWICNQLAPELFQVDQTVRIDIIGAGPGQVRSSWDCRNINFMGRADDKEFLRQVTSADLFIAPLANNDGAKMKLAECVSHGTPFIATEAAMSGLPFLPFVPRIDLDRPQAAARLVVDHMNSPETLKTLSRSILEHAQQAWLEQNAAWNTLLKRLVRKNSGRGTRFIGPNLHNKSRYHEDSQANPTG